MLKSAMRFGISMQIPENLRIINDKIFDVAAFKFKVCNCGCTISATVTLTSEDDSVTLEFDLSDKEHINKIYSERLDWLFDYFPPELGMLASESANAVFAVINAAHDKHVINS